jgi:hypothetical protein
MGPARERGTIQIASLRARRVGGNSRDAWFETRRAALLTMTEVEWASQPAVFLRGGRSRRMLIGAQK